MITGGLINVVAVKHPNGFTKHRWRHVIATLHGRVGYLLTQHEVSHDLVDNKIVTTPDPHEDLWLYVFHGSKEYIGHFRSDAFTPDQIAATAAEFASTTLAH